MPATGSTSMFGRLRAAARTSAPTLAPSMISALERPSFANWLRSALVFASFTLSASMTMMPSSLALAESACLSASARTFFRSEAELRELAAQRLGLRFLHAQRLDDDDAVVPGLGRERVPERERAHLLQIGGRASRTGCAAPWSSLPSRSAPR